jgi:alkylation response protein AidB-like acyl-CoA dehydrogenase
MNVVEVARSLQPLVRAHADEAERGRRLAAPVLAGLADAGLFRMAAPAVYGGLEVDPGSMIAALEAVSEADGATGWTLMIGVETVGIATAALAPAIATALLKERPNVVFSGAINPLGRATPVEGGFMVSGQWPYASGCEGADFFWGGCILVDHTGEPMRTAAGYRQGRQAIVPRASYDVDRTWDAAGLCGSGSHDVVVAEVFVPDDFMTDIYGGGLSVDTPLFRLPIFSRLAFNKVGVATGVARAAVDAFRALATEKTPFRTTSLLRERPQAQLAVAEAEARLRSARAFVFEAVNDVWAATCAGRVATAEEQALVRLACSHCCAEAVRAVEIVYAQAGITASSPRSPLERAIRDVRVVPQHVMVAPAAIAAAGRVLLGLDADNAVF